MKMINIKKILPVAVLACVLALSGCGESVSQEAAVDVTARPLGQSADSKTEQTTQPAKKNAQNVYCSYERLNDNEKQIYDEMCSLIEQGRTEFELTYDEDDIAKVYYEVIADHPEYFWLGSGYSCTITTTNGKKLVSFKPIVSDAADIEQRKRDMDNTVNAILSSANRESALYDKLLYIHDYLVDNTDYDNDAYREMERQPKSDSVNDATTAYGTIIKKNAVCSGYSAAFQILAQKLGVPCGRVSGMKIGGGSHEWNYVILDGDYYYIDVTWDDPQSENAADSSASNKTYDFFCITTDELRKTHIIDSDQFVPDCTAVRYDYYRYNGLYMDTYERSRAENIIRNTTGSAVTMKFSTESERQRAVSELIDDNAFSAITGMNRYIYTMDDAGLTLTIYLD